MRLPFYIMHNYLPLISTETKSIAFNTITLNSDKYLRCFYDGFFRFNLHCWWL